MYLDNISRILIKIGSSSIVDTNANTLFSERMCSITDDILWLSRECDKEVILMSSGALAWGRICMSLVNTPKECMDNQQVSGACGQIGIAAGWAEAFQKKDAAIGQLLLVPEQVSSLTVKNTILHMFEHGMVPYINENIPVMGEYDNDGLAARVAGDLNCDMLILLSDVDGVYSDNPATNPDAALIPEINDIDEAIIKFGGNAVSGIGTGGMLTKLKAAKATALVGVDTIIASGQVQNPLRFLCNGGNYTRVRAK